MRRIRRLDGLGETYVDTTGGSAPVRPYRPPQPVVYVPPPTTPPNGPLGPGPIQFVAVSPVPSVTITRTPSSPADEAMVAELRIKATRALQIQREPSSPYDPEASYRQYQADTAARWAEYEARVAKIPWRGSKPRQGAHPVDVIRTLKRRHYAGSPDAEDAAKGFVWREERAEEQYLERQRQAWTEHVGKMKAVALTQKQIPISLPTVRAATDSRDKLMALRQAAGKMDWGAAWMADALVQKIADEMKISPAQATDIVYAAAAKDAMWLLRQATGMQDISGRVATDIKAGGGEIGTALKAGLDKLTSWISGGKEVARKTREPVLSFEQRVKESLAPVAESFAGKITQSLIQSSMLTTSDIDKTKSAWGQFTTSSGDRLVSQIVRKTGILRGIGAAASAAGLIKSIKNNANLLSRYANLLPAIQATMDPTVMSADNKDEASKRDTLERAASAINTIISTEAALATGKQEAVPAMHRAAPEKSAPALSKREEQKIRAQLNREGWLPDAIEVYIAQVKGGRP